MEPHARGILGDDIDVGLGLHEIGDPPVEGCLRGWIVNLPVMISGNGEDRRGVALVRLIELRIVIIVRSGEVDHVANVIAELRRVCARRSQFLDHLLGHMGLKLGILNPSGISHHVENHFPGIGDVLGHCLEVVGQSVIVRGKAQRLGQGLVAGITVREGTERSHAGVRLRLAFFEMWSNLAGLHHGVCPP